jgi:alkanesulfonate monooxygenase SsuD/methylene tetrahydromethanopterin reductase-like flavin-dependent oxidoreductase (luciferase family)
MTIDHASHGRLDLSFGAAWFDKEHHELGIPFPPTSERFDLLEDALEIITRLFSGEAVDYAGKRVSLQHATMLPLPVQRPHPPIWIGGHTAPAIRRAARLGDGWHPIGLRPPASLTPDEMRVAVARLRDEASKAGRNPQQITISFRAPIAFADGGGAQRQLLTGSVAAIQDDIGRYADCGVSHLIFDVMTPDVTEIRRVMERFARDVRLGMRV